MGGEIEQDAVALTLLIPLELLTAESAKLAEGTLAKPLLSCDPVSNQTRRPLAYAALPCATFSIVFTRDALSSTFALDFERSI